MRPTRGRLGSVSRTPRKQSFSRRKFAHVEDQHGVAVAERLDDVSSEVVADRVGVPFGPTHQVSDAVGVGVADLPGVLALDRAEQSEETGPHAIPRHTARKLGSDPTGDRVEFPASITNVLDHDDRTGADHGDPPWVIRWPG